MYYIENRRFWYSIGSLYVFRWYENSISFIELKIIITVGIYRATTPVIDHEPIVDRFSEKHDN